MRILFLTQVLPYPLDAGPKVRAYYTLRYLSQRHQITLLSFVRASDTSAAIDHLRSFCDAVHTVLMTRSFPRDVRHLLHSFITASPFLITRDWLPAMADRIAQIVRDCGPFDAVHADQLWMAPYALWAKQVSVQSSPLLVLDQHNAVFQIPQRLAASEQNRLKRGLLAREGRKLACYEAQICQRFDHVVWVTEEDRAALLYYADGRKAAVQHQPANPPFEPSSVIPICVDPEASLPLRPGCHRRRVTFLGGMHWPPNAEGILWFVREIWPTLLKQAPDALLTVIGKDPPAELRQPGVDVAGFVEDLQPYLAETAVFIVPLHAGGGMRVKILDAWCWGLPVVSTGIGAEGLAVRDGENMLIADNAEAFVAAVLRLLREPDLAMHLSRAGQCTVDECYSWRKIYRAWDDIYCRLDHTKGEW